MQRKVGYVAKIEESEKPAVVGIKHAGHLWLQPPVLCHRSMTDMQPPTLTRAVESYFMVVWPKSTYKALSI